MDRRQFFGDSVGGTVIRLILLSIVVGIVFSALGITPFNIVERLQLLEKKLIEPTSSAQASLQLEAIGTRLQER